MTGVSMVVMQPTTSRNTSDSMATFMGRKNASRQSVATKRRIVAANMASSSSAMPVTDSMVHIADCWVSQSDSMVVNDGSQFTPSGQSVNITMPIISNFTSFSPVPGSHTNSDLYAPMYVSSANRVPSSCSTNSHAPPFTGSPKQLVPATSDNFTSAVCVTSSHVACAATEMHDLSTVTSASLHVVLEDSFICPDTSVQLNEGTANINMHLENELSSCCKYYIFLFLLTLVFNIAISIEYVNRLCVTEKYW